MNNKHLKTFYLEGLSGLVIILMFLVTLASVFFFIPVWVIKNSWNILIPEFFNGVSINFYQGSLLWIGIVLILYLNLASKIHIELRSYDNEDGPVDPEEIIQELKSKDRDKKI